MLTSGWKDGYCLAHQELGNKDRCGQDKKEHITAEVYKIDFKERWGNKRIKRFHNSKGRWQNEELVQQKQRRPRESDTGSITQLACLARGHLMPETSLPLTSNKCTRRNTGSSLITAATEIIHISFPGSDPPRQANVLWELGFLL